nr:hypothetical protein [Alysiella crassa]UOP05915.1 hypothetical protein LVJ80_08485 [Alysiella crassa]
MSNTHFLKNLLILLLPALLVGGLLSIAGDKADGLKIGLLSLCGGAVMLLAYAKHSKIMAWIASVWWVLFVAHSLILSASWLWYDSSLDAYFVTQSLANTTFHESVEFLQLHAFNLVVMMAAVVLTVFAYVFILKKYFNPSLYQQAKRWHKIVMFILLLIGVAAWAIRPIRALYRRFIGKLITIKSKHSAIKPHSIKLGNKIGSIKRVKTAFMIMCQRSKPWFWCCLKA